MLAASRAWCGLLLFVTSGTGHQVAYGVGGSFVTMEDGIHLLGDRHLDAVAGGEPEGGGGGADSLGHLASHAGEDIVELAAAAELDADGAVTRERAGAGEDEVAHAGEAGEGLAAASA